MKHQGGPGLEAWAEAVLDTPFKPALYQEPALRPPHRLLPVQHYAQEYLLQEFPDICHPSATPDDASVHEIRTLLGEADVDLLRNYVGMAHGMAEAASKLQREQYEDSGLQARADYQYSTTQSILRDLQLLRMPGSKPYLPHIEDALQTGVAVVAPCGFGKTWVGAQAMAAANIGRRLHADDPEPVRGLVVVPSIDRLQEYIEEDERNIFRRIIGFDVPVGQYYGQGKDVQPLTVITEASLRKVVQSGAIPTHRLGMVLFDEIHHGTSPQNMAALRKISGAVTGLTATPAYSYMRDIRRHFPHIEVGNLRQFTELGILNRARLLTYRAPEGEQGMELSAVSLAVQWLRQGRRVVVYAPRNSVSQETHSVDRITAEINRQMEADVVGAARSSMGQQAQTTVSDFRDKRLQGLVTVNMISVGSNVEADTLIMCGPLYSEVSFMQKVGRAMRPTEKETILAEIWPHVSPQRKMVTLAMLFGIENYQQGMLIGRAVERRLWLPRDLQRGQEMLEALSELPPMKPEEIRAYQVGGARSECYQKPPEGWLDDFDVVRRYNSTEECIRRTLDEASIPYTKRPSRGGVRRQHWYGPPAITYLNENPPMQVCGETFKTFSDIAEMLDVPEWLVGSLCEQHDIPREDKLIEQLAQEKCLSDEAVQQLMNVLYDLPVADVNTNASLTHLASITGESFVKEFVRCAGIKPELMRYGDEFDAQGFGFFMGNEESQQLLEWHKQRNNREGLVPLKDVAERSGNTLAYILSALQPAEKNAISFRYPGGMGRRILARYIPKEQADAIVAREKLLPLDARMVARSAIRQLFDAPPSKVHAEVAQHTPEAATYTGRVQFNRTVNTYIPWDAVAAAKDRGSLPLAAAFQNLNFSRLTTDYTNLAEDAARSELLHARLAQAALMPWYRQDTWHTIEEAALAMNSRRYVIDAFHTTNTWRKREYLRQNEEGEPEVHFTALAAMFRVVAAAPRLLDSGEWRSHTSILRYVDSKGVSASYVSIPIFGYSLHGSRPRDDIMVGRAVYSRGVADIYYSKNLGNRIIRKAMQEARDADSAQRRRQGARYARD